MESGILRGVHFLGGGTRTRTLSFTLLPAATSPETPAARKDLHPLGAVSFGGGPPAIEPVARSTLPESPKGSRPGLLDHLFGLDGRPPAEARSSSRLAILALMRARRSSNTA
jgi:hypothetical protein